MKEKHIPCLVLFLAIISCLIPSGCQNRDAVQAEDHWSITSVDGSLCITAGLTDGQVWYQVEKEGVPVVERSGLGLTTTETDFACGLSFHGKSGQKDVRVQYDPLTGKASHVETVYSELALTFRPADQDGLLLDVIFRAYPDGYALRYGIRAEDGSSGKLSITGEKTSFALPPNSVCYFMPFSSSETFDEYFSYEERYERRRSESLSGSILTMPFLYETADGVWLLITEADLYGHDYIGSYLRGNEKYVLCTAPAAGANMGTVDPGAEDAWAYQPFTVRYPFTSPWRLGITGSLADIVESTLVEDVYGEIDYWYPEDIGQVSAEAQETYGYEWVQPGVSVWSFLYYRDDKADYDNQWNYELQTKYIDYAKEMGWSYVLLDGGWQRNFEESKRIIEYANTQGVRILVWCHAINHLGTEELRTYYLDLFQSWGIAGIKPDYFDGHYFEIESPKGECQEIIDLYETIYQECAKRQLLVNPHGGNKPTGERRLYPHVLNREAVRGEEFPQQEPDQLTAIPFLRGVIGPTDYTPALKPLGTRTTAGMQLALHVMYETGVISLSCNIDKDNDYANSYDGYPECVRFLRDLPTTWDEIRFLDGEPLKFCSLARRNGEEWWASGITNLERTFQVDLSFLQKGQIYTAQIWTDGDLSTQLHYREESVTQESTLTLPAAAGGGFTLRLLPVANNP